MTKRRVFVTYVCPVCGLKQEGVPACAFEAYHDCFTARKIVKLERLEDVDA